ncbi:mucoidy inhibitor MuiA family protein [Bordetella trematum]|uniref:mucoidy inhibitor MuiA family protein n=1 Tax=Bordetella trematum TaxID=123899 RepID=UPI002F90889D
MRRSILLLACCAAMPGWGWAAALPSTIEAVTVYPDRAVVTRQASVSLGAGEHELVFERLPASLQDNSLQVSAHSTGQATLLDVKTATAYLSESANSREQALQQQIRDLQARLNALEDEAAVLENQREWVALMQRGATEPGRDGARLTIEQLNAVQAQSADTLARALSGLRRVAEQRDALERELNALEQSQQQLRQDSAQRSKTVTLRVQLAKPGKVDVGLSYAVAGARWTPAYDARLRGAKGQVDLGYYGVVQQRTGEDWDKVRLTLSTARPSLGGAVPESLPWILDVAPPPPPMPAPRPAPVADARQARMAYAQAATARSQARMAEEIALPQAELNDQATSASFALSAPASVPADNSAQRVAITRASLPATLRYEAVPGLRETAFLSAKASNDTAYPMLGGPLNSFLDDAFIAASTIKTVMPGEELELALGADEGIAVKRDLVNRFTKNTGFSGSGRRVTYEYKIKAKNNKTAAVQLQLSDRLPVSRNEKIVVKLLSPGDVTRGDEGKLSWTWDLEPGQSRETTLKFSIDYPADLPVQGL